MTSRNKSDFYFFKNSHTEQTESPSNTETVTLNKTNLISKIDDALLQIEKIKEVQVKLDACFYRRRD